MRKQTELNRENRLATHEGNIYLASLSFLRACFLHSSLAPTHAHLLKHYTKHI